MTPWIITRSHGSTRGEGRKKRLGIVLVVLFFFAFYCVFGLAGFNPTDDGFVLGQSWRLLQGQVPFRDFTSPRPIGSAYVHLLEFMPSSSLLAWSRLVVLGQLVLIAFLLVSILRITKTMSVFLLPLFTVLAFCINVNSFPLMAWHTIDGLFFASIAVWFCIQGLPNLSPRINYSVAFFFAGVAPLMKQGFLIVPAVVAVICIVKKDRTFLRLAPLASIAPLLFAIYFLIRAGATTLLSQLATSSPANAELFLARKGPLGFVPFALESVLSKDGLIIIGLAWTGAVLVSFSRSYSLQLFGASLCVVPLVVLIVQQRAASVGSWSYLTFGVLAIVALYLARTRTDWIFLIALGGLAIAVSVSWGIPTPSLVAGSAYVGIAHLIVNAIAVKDHERKTINEYTAVVLLSVLAVLSVLSSRSVNIYEQGALNQLRSSVANHQLAGIRMQEGTAQYLSTVDRCLKEFPAKRVAIIPDGPGLYPLFGIKNPFPFDWWWPWERVASSPRQLRAAQSEMNSGGDWLVLVQTYVLVRKDAGQRYGIEPASPELEPGSFYWSGTPDFVDEGTGVASYYVPGDAGIVAGLKGKSITCGPFVGKYSPASQR